MRSRFFLTVRDKCAITRLSVKISGGVHHIIIIQDSTTSRNEQNR